MSSKLDSMERFDSVIEKTLTNDLRWLYDADGQGRNNMAARTSNRKHTLSIFWWDHRTPNSITVTAVNDPDGNGVEYCEIHNLEMFLSSLDTKQRQLVESTIGEKSRQTLISSVKL